MEAIAVTTPYQDLSSIITALRPMVGGWFSRGLMSQALMMLVDLRLSVIRVKMERLVVRFQSGKLWRPVPRVVVRATVSKVVGEAVVAASKRIWPGRFGWLIWLGGWQAAGRGSQLRATLEKPEMVALLMAAPQAARLLRPLCRMLAVETSVLRPRPAGFVAEVTPPKVVAEVKMRVRRPRVPVDWGRIPLPRGVLSAARRQGFGKVPREKVD